MGNDPKKRIIFSERDSTGPSGCGTVALPFWASTCCFHWIQMFLSHSPTFRASLFFFCNAIKTEDVIRLTDSRTLGNSPYINSWSLPVTFIQNTSGSKKYGIYSTTQLDALSRAIILKTHKSELGYFSGLDNKALKSCFK